MTEMSTQFRTLISRLDGVRSLSPQRDWVERYLAKCPAHDDKHPSLLVSITNRGIVQAHCQSGCAMVDVFNAVGMLASDFMPNRSGRPFTPKLDYEKLVIECYRDKRKKGGTFEPDEIEAVKEALEKVKKYG